MGVNEIIRERECSGRAEEYQVISERGRVKMLTLLKRDGSMHCANYAFLHGVSGGEQELRMDFSRYIVLINGDHLGPIHRGLANHRITFLRESMSGGAREGGKVWIERILILHGNRSEPAPRQPLVQMQAMVKQESLAGRRVIQRLNTICSGILARRVERDAACGSV